ncbi:hypothetical protein SPI_06021 [Niveomyces insectorum RCEF 264]|uniref:Uncharacterized protein n=1 Tax=Niveomyces insectorum RCEF 264 TaxID=1081102 RepID=A0A167SQ50_9HYPO|nr:hypothetical protein SPI_06021 [Niveomyces insectorum RCEF 264]
MFDYHRLVTMPRTVHAVLLATPFLGLARAAVIHPLPRDAVFNPEDGAATVSGPGDTLIDPSTLNKLVARAADEDSTDCFSIETGTPSNMHWNKRPGGKDCRPKLPLVDGSCHTHMDLGTRCAAFCQISAFYYFAEPIDLMSGKMCRYGEGCELRREQSFRVEISNQEVERHVFDAATSLNPSLTWGLGFGTAKSSSGKSSAALFRRAQGEDEGHEDAGAIANANDKHADGDTDAHLLTKRSTASDFFRKATGRRPQDGHERGYVPLTEEEEKELAAEMERWPAKKIEKTTGGTGTDGTAEKKTPDKADKAEDRKKDKDGGKSRKGFSFPVPQFNNPQATVAMSFSAHWTNDWTSTYHHSVERATFTSLTQKQVPGEGCGAFWAVPVAVAYCGWLALPRFPHDIQEDALNWLRTTADTYEGTVKLGSWTLPPSHRGGKAGKAGKAGMDGKDGKDGKNNAGEKTKKEKIDPYPAPMWNMTAGRCPKNYVEMPYCHSGALYRPGPDGGGVSNGEALHRTVWRPYDCETGVLLPTQYQPREVREQLNFNQFFVQQARHDARLYNPNLDWRPEAHQPDDALWEEDDDLY